MTLLVGSIFHMTRKIVSEMTYNVSMGTLNPTIPHPTQAIFDIEQYYSKSCGPISMKFLGGVSLSTACTGNNWLHFGTALVADMDSGSFFSNFHIKIGLFQKLVGECLRIFWRVRSLYRLSSGWSRGSVASGRYIEEYLQLRQWQSKGVCTGG